MLFSAVHQQQLMCKMCMCVCERESLLGYTDNIHNLTGQTCLCCIGERGGTSKPGRAFSLRSGRAESSRGVGPPAAEKENPPFFIVKDAVECDGLIWNGPGRGISERKRTDESAFGKGGKPKTQIPLSPPTLWSCLRIYGWTCPRGVGNSESCRPHELMNRGKLWIYRSVFLTRRWNR